MRGMEWTPECIETAKQMRKDGKSNKEIADHFDTTRNAISGLFYRIKMTPQQQTEERKRFSKRSEAERRARSALDNGATDDKCEATNEELCAAALVADGANFYEAAAELEVSVGFVRRAVEYSKVRERAEIRRGATDRLTAWARNGECEANNKRLRKRKPWTPEQKAAAALLGQAESAERRRDGFRRS